MSAVGVPVRGAGSSPRHASFDHDWAPRAYLAEYFSGVQADEREVMAALQRARWYTVGGRRFPSADVDVEDLRDALRPDFEVDAGSFEVRQLPEHRSQGYAGIVLASIRRRPCGAASSERREPS